MRLIDADALIEKFNEKCDMATSLIDEKTAERFHTFCILADAVEAQPTIDAVPVVHGKWEFIDKYKVQCSVCLRIRNGKTQRMWEYCPNCGARMDGEDEQKN